jgi:hypothetical protein
MLLELALALPQPRIAPLPPVPHDLTGVELERHLIARLALWLAGRLRALLLAAQLLAGPAEELAPALRRAQPLGQLITTRLAERFVLGLIGRPDLGQDLARDLLELVVDLRARVPAILVPSIDTTPGFASPAFAQSFNTSLNSSASARSWRQIKRAIVA